MCFSRAPTGKYWLAEERWGAEEEGAGVVALRAEVEGKGEEGDAVGLQRKNCQPCPGAGCPQVSSRSGG